MVFNDKYMAKKIAPGRTRSSSRDGIDGLLLFGKADEVL
jgi:hypothetical protein